MGKATANNEMHKAAAQVGKDTIEDAEYFVFNYDRPKRAKTFKDKLDDLWLGITLPFHRLKGKIRDIYYEIRYGFERMFRGYDSVDCFSTFSKFTERYYKILTEYKKTHQGYPCNMSGKEWEDIVDEMIYHLYYMDEDNVEKELCKNMPEDWTPSWKTIGEIMDRHKDEFFKLFSKHFYNLWD